MEGRPRSAHPKRVAYVTNYVRDWVLIATVPAWLPYVLDEILRDAKLVRSPLLPSAALLAYALAAGVAHLDNPPLDAWRESSSRFLRSLSYFVGWAKWIIVIFASIVVTVIGVSELTSRENDPLFDQNLTFTLSASIAATAAILGLFAVANAQDQTD